MKLASIILSPFSLIYTGVTDLRNLLYDKKVFKSSEFDVPIINIGNLRVGGTGKSPHVEYVCNLLNHDFDIAILSRGYGRKTSGFKKVEQKSKATDVGDEPLQFKTKFPDVDVNVSENRVNGIIEILMDNENTDAIILDDAFQHRAIKAGLNIIITDFSDLFTKDFVLPMGRLRERKASAKRADLVIVSKCPENLSEQQKHTITSGINRYTKAEVLFSKIKYKKAKHLFNYTELDQNTEEVYFFSGIANSDKAANYLKSKHKKLHHKKFKDHFKYNEKSVQEIISDFDSLRNPDKCLVCTEKDAVKLKEFDQLKKYPIFVIGIEVEFLGKDKDKFDKKIIEYVRSN